MNELAQRANEAVFQLQYNTNQAMHYVMYHLPEVKSADVESALKKAMSPRKKK